MLLDLWQYIPYFMSIYIIRILQIVGKVEDFRNMLPVYLPKRYLQSNWGIYGKKIDFNLSINLHDFNTIIRYMLQSVMTYF